ncbi:PREDICTED: small integral membrane protein 12-like [Chinchilla lanigera]|uniref:small integral membrane protein 12-like n=1 Tax=Chinchilla lanigera TaxID=34839 RepID=UPI00038EFE5D|nr:PREDICTED: small integral membrane protein 12-like [Chinchilla lanigera]
MLQGAEHLGRELGQAEDCGLGLPDVWLVLWTMVHTYVPYVIIPGSFTVGAVHYHLEWYIRRRTPSLWRRKSISECQENCRLDKVLGKDHRQVVSLQNKVGFTCKAFLNRNCPEN